MRKMKTMMKEKSQLSLKVKKIKISLLILSLFS